MNQAWTILSLTIFFFVSGCGSQGDLTAQSGSGEAPTAAAEASAATGQEAAGQGAEERPTAQLIAIPNALQPQPGLVVGGQPSDEALTAAAQAGFKTVINLRGEKEMAGSPEPARVEELGMRYVPIPVEMAAGLNEANARALDEALADPAAYPILLHCGSGNRVGGLLALRAHYVDGLPAEEALALGLASGLTGLEGSVREVLGLEPTAAP
jgi:uncharacterized protein (TIGR01244 family)